MAILALVVLVLAIVIGTKKKINIGIMGIIGACILSLIAKISIRDLVAGFNTTLFLRLLGIQLLVCAAQTNGTMDTLAKKLVYFGGKKSIKLIPIIIYVLLVVIGMAGVDVIFLATPFVVALALQLGMSPIKVMFSLILSFQASAMSPLATSGVNCFSVAEKSGVVVNGWSVAINCCISATLIFVIAYFVFGWYKEKNREIEGMENAKFELKHILTLLGFVAYVILTLGFKLDIIVAPTLIVFVLFMINAADPKKTIGAIPWNVLIMIGGMSLMTGVVAKLGGVALLASLMSKISIPFIQAPLMVIIAGTMSFFASGNGVVIPTLVPVVSGMTASSTALVTAISAGAGTAGCSPFSTIGGHMMSCYDAMYKPTEEERTKTFNQLMLFVILCLAAHAVLSLLGLFNLTMAG